MKSKASGIVKNCNVDYGDKVSRANPLPNSTKSSSKPKCPRICKRNYQAARQGRARFPPSQSLEQNKVDAEGQYVPFLKLNLWAAPPGNVGKTASWQRVWWRDAEKNYQMALNTNRSVHRRTLIVAKAEIAKAEAEVAQAKAALENAEEKIRNSTIVSPIDGWSLFARRQRWRRGQLDPRSRFPSHFVVHSWGYQRRFMYKVRSTRRISGKFILTNRRES